MIKNGRALTGAITALLIAFSSCTKETAIVASHNTSQPDVGGTERALGLPFLGAHADINLAGAAMVRFRIIAAHGCEEKGELISEWVNGAFTTIDYSAFLATRWFAIEDLNGTTVKVDLGHDYYIEATDDLGNTFSVLEFDPNTGFNPTGSLLDTPVYTIDPGGWVLSDQNGLTTYIAWVTSMWNSSDLRTSRVPC